MQRKTHRLYITEHVYLLEMPTKKMNDLLPFVNFTCIKVDEMI